MFSKNITFSKHHYSIEIEEAKANKVTAKLEIKWQPMKDKLDVLNNQR